MTLIIFSRTTSSPEESLVSNLQCETVLLRSTRACSRPIEVGAMSPQMKKVWRADNAADVIGPVERGDRIIAKNGARITGSAIVVMSSRMCSA